MKLKARFGERIIKVIESYRKRRRENVPGPIGDFCRAGGNELLFVDLPLSSADTVVDAGGFKGDWTREVLVRYGCRSIVFEPEPSMASGLRQVFGNNERVEVIDAALFGSSGNMTLYSAGDGSTVVGPTDHTTVTCEVEAVDVSSFVEHRMCGVVDCLKLNVEGAEYSILERLLEKNMLRCIRCLIIQFHRSVVNGDRRRLAIHSALARSHVQRFDFPFVWEMWVRHGA